MSDAGGTTTWVYNVHGQVTAKQQTSGSLALTTNRTYNATTGQLASLTYPSGSSFQYSYDANGRVSAVSSGQSGLLSQIAYQPFGPSRRGVRPMAHSLAVRSIRTGASRGWDCRPAPTLRSPLTPRAALSRSRRAGYPVRHSDMTQSTASSTTRWHHYAKLRL